MTHEEKITWMAVWVAKNGFALDLKGQCGFGRECVGITVEGNYPAYMWYDGEDERADANGDVWTPRDAYHKSECVAVLGRGEKAESQLYDWLRWFDENGFVLDIGNAQMDPRLGEIGVLMGKHRYAHMVRSIAPPAVAK